MKFGKVECKGRKPKLLRWSAEIVTWSKGRKKKIKVHPLRTGCDFSARPLSSSVSSQRPFLLWSIALAL